MFLLWLMKDMDGLFHQQLFGYCCEIVIGWSGLIWSHGVHL